MARDAVGRLGARFVFVVGKGGVGKTTTAGALALASADEGLPTHLVSTDPAHSLGDLFGTDLSSGAPEPSPCSPLLTVEELDAEGLADRWLERVRGPLSELIDRGTWLDSDEVEGFLDLSLPGVDEVAAVLRLSELASGDARRVVVDTAPTGHTLRLLGSAPVLRSWIAALRAMEEKAVVVAERLSRRRVRMAAADVLDELEERIESFEERVLGDGEAVVVEGPGALVEAESGRLRRSLGALGLPVALRAWIEPPAGAGDATAPPRGDDADESRDPQAVPVPWRLDLAGCEGLRRWGDPAGDGAPSPDAPALRSAEPGGDDALPRLLDALPGELLLVVGKGGVGKTTCAAALALEASRTRPVTLLGTDPAGSLDDLLGSGSPPGQSRGAGGSGDLRIRQVDAEADFAGFRERYRDDVDEAFRSVGLDRAASLDRRVVASLLDLAPPGADEVFSLAALLDDDARGRLQVVDTAPTGHALRLLEMPDTALAWTRQALRVVSRTRSALRLDALAERLLDFAKRLKNLKLTLEDPARGGVVVVTLPGPLARAETRRLLDEVAATGPSVVAVIRNRDVGGETGLEIPPGSLDVRAPFASPPPLGGEALVSFARRWRLPS